MTTATEREDPRAGAMPVKVAYAAVGGGSTPVWTAYETGIFERNGLDVELALIRGSHRVAAALAAGDVDFANVAGPSVVKTSLLGSEQLVYVTGGVNHMIQTLVTRPDVTDPRQLRGQTLGKRGGDLEQLVFDHHLAGVGLDPATDVEFVLAESQPEALAAMERGEICGALFTPPWLFEATKRGFTVLLDPGELAVDFQLGGLITRERLVRSRPECVRAMVRSYVEGMRYADSHPSFVVDLLARYSGIEDPEVATRCYEHFKQHFRPAPYPSVEGIRAILRLLAPYVDAAAGADPERFVDRGWVAELADNGFVDRLSEAEDG